MTMHFLHDETGIATHPTSKITPSLDADASTSNSVRAFRRINSKIYRHVVKRSLDICLTVLASPFVLPLVVMMVTLIALNGQNPFYSQQRVGKNGKTFRMWKLRTMVHDAEAHLARYLAKNHEARQEWDATQKLKDDPRITKLGRILRKTSLDELPQLWNVLTGDMSLVGPRPMMLCQRKSYPGTSYYNLRPGITGLWQISDRNECEFVDRAYYDDLYDREISFRTDLQILVRTVGVVLRGTGY